MTFAYTPAGDGGWIALVSVDRALLLGGPVDEALVDGAWARLDDGAGALLELITSRGLQATPPFALVEPTDAGVRAIVRGGATVAVGGESISGIGAATWIERVVPAGAIAVEVVDAVGGAPVLPLHAGAARVAALRSSAARAAADRPRMPERPAATEPPAPAPSAPEPRAAERRTPEPRATEAPTAAAGPDSTVAEETVAEETVAEETVAEVTVPPGILAAATAAAAPASAASAPPSDAPESDYDYLFGDTMYRSVGDAAIREEEAPEGGEAESDAERAGDHDGATMLVSQLGRRKRAPRGAAAAPAPAAIAVLLPGDAREVLDEPIIVGRAPSVSHVPGGQMPRLVTIGGGDQDISRSHVRLALEGGTVVVTDLHSKNGTHVVLPGKDAQKLRAGEPTPVIVGTVVDLGGGVQLRVEEL